MTTMTVKNSLCGHVYGALIAPIFDIKLLNEGGKQCTVQWAESLGFKDVI